MNFFNTRLTTEGLRHYNRGLVLGAVRRFGSLSHTDISSKTALASGTISAITGELLEEGVLTKVEQENAPGRGRPRVLFAMEASLTQIVLVRISIAEISLSLIDYAGKMHDRQVLPRGGDRQSAEQFSLAIKDAVTGFIERNNLKPDEIPLISITTKAELDAREGVMVWSPVFGRHRLDFSQVFADWSADVTLSHQTGLMAFNLLSRRMEENKARVGDRLAVLSLGDSIGLGLAHMTGVGEIEYSAPGFGHMTHSIDGPLCRCGANGCVETFAGFYGILRTALDGPADHIPKKYVAPEQMAQLAQNARNGDRATILAFREAGAALGMALSRLFSVLGTMPVTVTGAGLVHFDLLEDALRSALQKGFAVSMGDEVQITFEPDELVLSHDANALSSLKRLDMQQVATRSLFGVA